MTSIQEERCQRVMPSESRKVKWIRALAWVVVVVAFLNTLYYVLLTSNPVIRSDAWYFLDVFLRKAADGSLGIADFFVKRNGADHAQPLLKLLLLFEWRYFDLDFVSEAVVGVLAAAACTVILYRFIATAWRDGPVGINPYLAWAAMSVLLLSLNAAGIWTWSLVAIGYVNVVLLLLFMGAVWHAQSTGHLLPLVVATILLGILADDSASIAAVTTILALVFMAFRDVPQRTSAWKTVLVIVACMLLVRFGYSFAPVLGGASDPSLTIQLSQLLERLHQGDWWKWFALPLSLPVVYEYPGGAFSSAIAWPGFRAAIVVCLLIAHGVFWWRAWRGGYNLPMFAAVCVMLLSYAWWAGILVVRVSYFGTAYLYQDRYVELYQFNLVALLMMWAGATPLRRQSLTWPRKLTNWLSAVGCLALITLQFPLSYTAWTQGHYLIHYYQQMATQLGQLSEDPAKVTNCLPELVVCADEAGKRDELIQFLRKNQLNVFSPRVQAWHGYLPRLPTVVEKTP